MLKTIKFISRAKNNIIAKKALRIGVSGQDVFLLSQLLLKKGYGVDSSSRDAQIHEFQVLKSLGMIKISPHSFNTRDFRNFL